MNDVLIQRITNILEIVGVLWLLIIGSKTLPQLLKGTLTRRRFMGIFNRQMGIELFLGFVIGVVIIGSTILGGLIFSKIPIPFSHSNTLSPSSDTANATSTAIVENTATAEATATAQVIAENPYPAYLSGHGILILYDPMSMYESDADKWWGGSYSGYGDAETCDYADGYHIRETRQGYYFYCFAQSYNYNNDLLSNLADLAFEVHIKVIVGNCGGIFFRADIDAGSSYYFRVCENGFFQLIKYTDFSSAHSSVLISLTNSQAIKTGLDQDNLIAVVAQGESIKLYVNKQLIADIQDSTYHKGSIALAADAFQEPTEVKFSDAKVWYAFPK